MKDARERSPPGGDADRRAADFDRNAPLKLATAARVAFPDGTVSADTLMRQHRRGLLVIERIGSRYFTTLADIDEMRSLCRVTPNPPASVSAAAPGGPTSTSSATADLKSARAAALIASQRLKKRSRVT